MNPKVLKYYLSNRPLFLAIIRASEIPFYLKYANLKGKVLDFGCGDGFFLDTLRKFSSKTFRMNEVIGIDVERKILSEAQKYNLYDKLKIYNGKNIPFPDNYFDTIISNCVFEHLPNLESNLEELNRVLKKKGILYTTVMTNKWEEYVILPKKFWSKKQKHHNLLSDAKWNSLFEKTGFTILKKEDYLNKTQSRMIEILHFLSIPYLISYKILNDWSKVGTLYSLFTPIDFLTKLYSHKLKPENSAALFFKLQK